MISKTLMASRVLQRSGLGTLLRKTSGHRGFVVLNYHRIGKPEQSEFDRGVFSATPEAFEQQLKFLRNDCDVILPSEIPDLPRRGRGNYAIITFDDGYRDNYDIAFPLLKSAGLKAVFFIATGFIEGNRLSWWDEIAWMARHSCKNCIGPTSSIPAPVPVEAGRQQQAIDELLTVYKKLPPDVTELFLNDLAEETGAGRAPEHLATNTWMTWQMIREMRDAGMAIGGHTVHHPILSNLPSFEQELEIVGCAGALDKNLGQTMSLFSYPRGKPDAFNDDTRACLAKTQVQYAFTYYGGMNRPEALDRFDVRRVAVESDTPIEHFEAMVTLPRLFA